VLSLLLKGTAGPYLREPELPVGAPLNSSVAEPHVTAGRNALQARVNRTPGVQPPEDAGVNDIRNRQRGMEPAGVEGADLGRERDTSRRGPGEGKRDDPEPVASQRQGPGRGVPESERELALQVGKPVNPPADEPVQEHLGVPGRPEDHAVELKAPAKLAVVADLPVEGQQVTPARIRHGLLRGGPVDHRQPGRAQDGAPQSQHLTFVGTPVCQRREHPLRCPKPVLQVGTTPDQPHDSAHRRSAVLDDELHDRADRREGRPCLL
jgi:hypothetical protein